MINRPAALASDVWAVGAQQQHRDYLLSQSLLWGLVCPSAGTITSLTTGSTSAISAISGVDTDPKALTAMSGSYGYELRPSQGNSDASAHAEWPYGSMSSHHTAPRFHVAWRHRLPNLFRSAESVLSPRCLPEISSRRCGRVRGRAKQVVKAMSFSTPPLSSITTLCVRRGKRLASVNVETKMQLAGRVADAHGVAVPAGPSLTPPVDCDLLHHRVVFTPIHLFLWLGFRPLGRGFGRLALCAWRGGVLTAILGSARHARWHVVMTSPAGDLQV